MNKFVTMCPNCGGLNVEADIREDVDYNHSEETNHWGLIIVFTCKDCKHTEDE